MLPGSINVTRATGLPSTSVNALRIIQPSNLVRTYIDMFLQPLTIDAPRSVLLNALLPKFPFSEDIEKDTLEVALWLHYFSPIIRGVDITFASVLPWL